jgi:hypothetical protein
MALRSENRRFGRLAQTSSARWLDYSVLRLRDCRPFVGEGLSLEQMDGKERSCGVFEY